MLYIYWVLVTALSCLSICSNAEDPALRFQHKKMQELVVGYPLEEHFVETKDGYILGLYRIPPRNHPSIQRGHLEGSPAAPVVLLQHGLLDSSATWVVNHPNQSLGFILSDNGYDVWLGNNRGNAFSRRHAGFSPLSAHFWDFSFDDMAEYDLPATIDYILNHTGEKKLGYIGHSQGTTQAFAALSSSHHQLQDKLSIFIALAPAVYLKYISSIPLLFLAQLQADQFFQMLGEREFLPARKTTSDIFSQVCRATPLACLSVLTAICGFNEHNLNTTRLPLIVAYAPSGTSVKNMVHWSQLIRNSLEQRDPIFRRFDYGTTCVTPGGAPRDCNRRMYGSDHPPIYNISSIRNVPMAFFTGIQDKLSDPIDIETLVEQLSPGVLKYSHTELSYEHLDFVWGQSAAEKIYPDVLRLLSVYHHRGFDNDDLSSV